MTAEAITKGRNIRIHNAKIHKSNIQATEVAKLYRNMGLTYAAIADKLNQSHYLTRRQKYFDSKAVYRLLQRGKKVI